MKRRKRKSDQTDGTTRSGKKFMRWLGGEIDFAYHGTSRVNVASILRDGLLPSTANGYYPKPFVAMSRSIRQAFANGWNARGGGPIETYADPSVAVFIVTLFGLDYLELGYVTVPERISSERLVLLDPQETSDLMEAEWEDV
jgi:hypothetical protein